jgi:cytochrome c biogenesis protein CcmG/thiol:disulfide interchange protein DsbE
MGNRIISLVEALALGQERAHTFMAVTKGSTKQVVFLVILVLFGALSIIGYFAKERAVLNKTVVVGGQAPGFSLPSPEGRRISLSDFRGKVVLVHFWATWCPPCVEELPALDALFRAVANKEVKVLAVSLDEGGADAVAAFLKRHALTLPVLLDPERTVAGLYGTFKLPETYIVDRRGVVRYKAIGPRDWGDPAMKKIVQGLLDEQ